MRRLLLAFLAAAFVSVHAQQPPAPARPVPTITPVTDAMLQNPGPGEWLMWRRTLNTWGFSPLDQIKKSNVKDLRMVWTRGLTAGIQEGTPLVHDGVMFIPNPGDDIMAVDAKTGDLIWEYKRKLPQGVRPKTDRAMAMWGTTLINSSSDNFIYALDMATGKLVWETPVLDPHMRAPTSGGPIVANGKVITGRQCQPDATRDSCVVTAHDAKTGKELWRFHTIPGPGEPGDESWGGIPMNQRWHVGTWMVPSYDPELNLVILGTSVTIPAPKFILAGADKKYLFHNCTLALNADTGKLVWYYQHIVDHWDMDHPFERLLVDTVVAPSPSEVRWINPKVKPGERRKVVTGIPGKTGVVYTLDRQTGEFLWARPTVMQNVISNIDPTTGAVTVNPETIFTHLNDERFVCPGSNGGKNWPAGAYSPLTNMMYMPLQNLCMTATTTTDQRDPSKVYGISMKPEFAIGADKVGTVWAIAADTGKTMWKHEQRAGTLSLVTTGGGLVFGGDANGRFKAYDDRTGQVLWETIIGSAASGYPISYSVGGRQYVAIITGPSLAAQTDERQTPEYTPDNAPNIFVFALP
ncbi:MAG TPA: PQQ-binding-like beta-propeller repeat protein [Vicinamibacterales bacterium]|nr:PQQ-binding-like beta-propeller repeat protein [Vicinamibacterales bacterium]